MPKPSLTIDDVSILEGDAGTANADFTVRLSEPSADTVTVKYFTKNETAVAPGDYTAQPLTMLSFAPGDVTKTVSVPVAGDTVRELTETFRVNLTEAKKAVIGDSKGIGRIFDNEGPLSVFVDDVSVAETDSGQASMQFTVSLSETPAPGQTVTVNFATADDTATVAGGDYEAKSLALTFNSTTPTSTVTVLVTGDTNAEPDETFFARLSSPRGMVLGDNQGTGTIRDDD